MGRKDGGPDSLNGEDVNVCWLEGEDVETGDLVSATGDGDLVSTVAGDLVEIGALVAVGDLVETGA